MITVFDRLCLSLFIYMYVVLRSSAIIQNEISIIIYFSDNNPIQSSKRLKVITNLVKSRNSFNNICTEKEESNFFATTLYN